MDRRAAVGLARHPILVQDDLIGFGVLAEAARGGGRQLEVRDLLKMAARQAGFSRNCALRRRFAGGEGAEAFNKMPVRRARPEEPRCAAFPAIKERGAPRAKSALSGRHALHSAACQRADEPAIAPVERRSARRRKAYGLSTSLGWRSGLRRQRVTSGPLPVHAPDPSSRSGTSSSSSASLAI